MRVLLALLLLLSTSAASALAGAFDDPLDEAAIRAEYVERLRASGVFTEVTPLPDGTIEYSWAAGGPASSYLGNLYKDMRLVQPAEREAKLQAFVETAIRIATATDDVPDPASLMITVYDEGYIREVTALGANQSPALTFAEAMQPRQRIAGELWKVIVADTPVSVNQLDETALAEMGLSKAEAWIRATANLEQAASGLGLETHDGFWSLALDGYYENALMTVGWLWPRIGEIIEGTPVVSTPARGVVMIARADNPAGIEAMRIAAREVYESFGHPLTLQTYIWQDQGWEVF